MDFSYKPNIAEESKRIDEKRMSPIYAKERKMHLIAKESGIE